MALWITLKYPPGWTASFTQRVARVGETEPRELLKAGCFEEVNIKCMPRNVKVRFTKEAKMIKAVEERMSLSERTALTPIRLA